MQLSSIMFQTHDIGKSDINNTLFNNFSDKQKEYHVKIAGGFLHKLAQVVNEEITINSTFNFVPAMPAKAQMIFASAALLSTTALNGPAIARGSRPLGAEFAVVRHKAGSFNALSASIIGAFAKVYNFIGNIKDPIRFPLASAAALPEGHFSAGFGIDNSSSNHNGDNEILDDKNRYIAQLVAQLGNGHRDVKYTDRAVLVKSVIKALTENTLSQEEVALFIQTATGGYGVNPFEMMPPPMAKTIIDMWISENLFGAAMVDFITEAIVDSQKSEGNRLVFIKLRLDNAIYAFFSGGRVLAGSDVRDYIIRHIIAPVIPLLATPQLYNINATDPEWANKHAGASFALAAGSDTQALTPQDAAVLGRMICLQLNIGVVPDHWSNFFLIPALIDYSVDNPDAMMQDRRTGASALEKSALEKFFNSPARRREQDNPLNRFSELFASFQTRLQLAQANPQYHTRLLDERFKQQTDDLADAFYQVDRLLIGDVLSRLPEDEFRFINTSLISLPTFALIKQHETRAHVMLPALAYDPDRVTILPNPDDVDLIGAERVGERRIYALVKKQQQYELIRVDSDIARYKPLLAKEDRQRVQADFSLELTDRPAPATNVGETADEHLINTLALKHKNALRRALNDYGNIKTPVESLLESLFSMMPLYSCLTTGEEGEKGEKFYHCATDTLLLAPLLKAGAKLGLNKGVQSFRLGMIPALKLAGSGQAASLAKMAVHTADPLLKRLPSALGKTIVAQSSRLGEYLENVIPGIKNALRRMGNGQHMERLPLEFIPDKSIRIDGAKTQVGFIKPGGDKYLGREVYLRLNPDNTGIQSNKYTLYRHQIAVIPPQEAVLLANPIRYQRRPLPPVMAMNGAQPIAGTSSVVRRPVPNHPLPSFNSFMPMRRIAPLVDEYVSTHIDNEITRVFGEIKTVRVTGTVETQLSKRHPYLAGAQLSVSVQFGNVFDDIGKVSNFLERAKTNALEKMMIESYFSNALTVKDPFIVGLAVDRFRGIIDAAINLKREVVKNVLIVSTVREKNSLGVYQSALASPSDPFSGYKLLPLEGEILGFCVPGDGRNRVIVMADRLVQSLDKQEHLAITLMHEVTHLAYHTDDIYYLSAKSIKDLSPAKHASTLQTMLDQGNVINYSQIAPQIRSHLGWEKNDMVNIEMINQAISHDPMFRADIMTRNADSVVKFIMDIAIMERSRMKRDITGRPTRGPLEQALLHLTMKLAIDAVGNASVPTAQNSAAEI
ncbi:hypothetical protein ACL2XO_20680 [Sodalis sp. RH15]|uniref:hypothetical protein n=1 Tax=Sodalis sp. RH15 TaxID=3394330 RepID=UPI0039B4888B